MANKILKLNAVTSGDVIKINNENLTEVFRSVDITSGTDLNDIKTPGYYKISANSPNAPKTNAGTLLVEIFSASIVAQTYTYMGTPLERYTRRFNSTWSNWEKLETGITGNLTSPNLNDLKSTYIGYVAGCTNGPPVSSYGYLYVNSRSDTYVQQIYTAADNYDIYQRQNVNGTWSAWKKYSSSSAETGTVTASTTNFTDSSFTLVKTGQTCVLYFVGKLSISANGWINIGTIPTGFRPESAYKFGAVTRKTTNNYQAGSVLDMEITTAGAIRIYAFAGNNGELIRQSVTYICA